MLNEKQCEMINCHSWLYNDYHATLEVLKFGETSKEIYLGMDCYGDGYIELIWKIKNM
jgi:hypothetical protein